MRKIVYRTVWLLFVAGLMGSCASVDQYGSRAYDGNVNTQAAFNKEILANIIRASKYEALSWNPPSQITGSQMEQLTTGLPTINTGPQQMTPYQYSISNSLSSSVNGGFSTSPLATTSFQTGMLTPIDLKTLASLTTYYPRETIFYSLIAAIDVELVSNRPKYARLVNDPAQAYSDIKSPSDLGQGICDEIVKHANPKIFFGSGCSYKKFLNLLSLLIDNGLYMELVQIPAPQPAQAQANQSNMVTVGRFCFNKDVSIQQKGSDFLRMTLPICGIEKTNPIGGTIAVVTTDTNKADDISIRTHTNSTTTTTTTTKNSVIPITGHGFGPIDFNGIGPVEITFELRSPNGFLSYLGSWYNVKDRIAFDRFDFSKETRVPFYDTVQATQIFGNGPYLSILTTNGPSSSCYSSASYEGQTYCVPVGASHTTMLMDLAIMLRNLNISPTDLNAPVSVRVAN
jgi:hypothetical protein